MSSRVNTIISTIADASWRVGSSMTNKLNCHPQLCDSKSGYQSQLIKEKETSGLKHILGISKAFILSKKCGNKAAPSTSGPSPRHHGFWGKASRGCSLPGGILLVTQEMSKCIMKFSPPYYIILYHRSIGDMPATQRPNMKSVTQYCNGSVMLIA